VNRVGNTYIDQLELSGHATRESDLDLLTEIGFKAVRYPVLWERLAANGIRNIDWSWTDRRLGLLRDASIRPIVGLVHHGSGPSHTNLLDQAFPHLLAEFAQAVAERYPWIDAYTPVNEPLTTARFSGLYGHWYPHAKDDRSFFQALFNETRGTVLAMRAIRKINPQAQLVQVEDAAKIYSTPPLKYQADFENERRWLSLDLLSGTVGKDHPMKWYLDHVGMKPDDIEWFSDNPCMPDVIGMNYYLSSERFLDHRTELYPGCAVGGNGRDAYVDVEAARVLKDGIMGVGPLLREAWQRFHLPMAVTELHNGCTREEQARWFVEQWHSAASLVNEGIDVRAITAWALLGSFHWNKLVTACDGIYEPGVYELRSPQPLPTVMVKILKQIAKGEAPDHPALRSPGWWNRSDRHIYGVSHSASRRAKLAVVRTAAPEPPILITGRTGTLGRAFAKICVARGLSHRLLSRAEMDIANLNSVEEAIERWHPWAIVNAAGYVRVDDAEVESDQCMRENAFGPSILAAACHSYGIQLMTFSSDLVFDGKKATPYLESDRVAPLNVYGRSKVEAERAVQELCPAALIVRTSAFFGPWDDYNFVTTVLRAFLSEKPFTTCSDYLVSPTYVPDLVHASLDLLIDGARGIWHLANQGAVSWSGLATKAARMAGISTATLTQCKNSDWRFAAVRPHYSVLGSERACIMPSLEDALARYLIHPELSLRKSDGESYKRESQDDIAA
jgi:dTDP-4-dehydrorhamnose reductase